MAYDDFGYSSSTGNRRGIWTLVIVIAILLIIAVVLFFVIKPMLNNDIIVKINNTGGDSGIGGNTNTSSGEDFISYELLDENGNPINTQALSVVNYIPNVRYMILTATITNQGIYPLTCKIQSVTPAAISFVNQSMEKICPATGSKKVAWTSNIIDLQPYELPPTPDNIQVNVRCYYNLGSSTYYLPDKFGTITLRILNQTVKYTKVRLENTAMGYAEQCGDTLVPFGLIYDSCDSRSYVNCPNPWTIGSNSFTLITTNASLIPNKPQYADPNKGCLYIGNNTLDGERVMAVMWQKKYNGGTCAVAGYWGYRIFKPSDADAADLTTTSPYPVPNNSTEIYCYATGPEMTT